MRKSSFLFRFNHINGINVNILNRPEKTECRFCCVSVFESYRKNGAKKRELPFFGQPQFLCMRKELSLFIKRSEVLCVAVCLEKICQRLV